MIHLLRICSIRIVNLDDIIEKDVLPSDASVGLCGCRVSNNPSFDECGYDLAIFDNDTSQQDRFVMRDGGFVRIHHASFLESESKKLLQYDGMRIIRDKTWDLRTFLSKIQKRRNTLYADFAMDSLVEAIFCCQRAKTSNNNNDADSDLFCSCWQRCASYYLADAICALNNQRSSPSHMLEMMRGFPKDQVGECVSVFTQTSGSERATPTLLSRMVKSTIGFSDIVEENGHSEVIRQKHRYLVDRSMLSDCYFYLGYTNKTNLAKIYDTIHKKPDLIHILKVAFDVGEEPYQLEKNTDLVEESCRSLLEIVNGRTTR